MSAEPEILLHAIGRELKALSWWESVPPSARALATTAPSILAPLRFPQGLQFVLLAPMMALLAAGAPPPGPVMVTS